MCIRDSLVGARGVAARMDAAGVPRDVFTYATLLKAITRGRRRDQGAQAEAVLDEMDANGIQPDAPTNRWLETIKQSESSRREPDAEAVPAASDGDDGSSDGRRAYVTQIRRLCNAGSNARPGRKSRLGNPALMNKCLDEAWALLNTCLLYTSPSPRDKRQSRMPSSA